MMMNKREGILLVLVLAIVGGYGVFLLVQRAFLGPLDAQTAQILKLQNDLAGKQREMDRAIKAGDRLAEWEKISLPADEQIARSMYQEFLLKLMEDCHVQDGKLNVEKSQRNNKIYTAIPFNIQGKMTLENLTEFLYRFHQPNLMHQIRAANFKDAGGKMLSVNLAVVGLSLPTAPRRERLIPEDQESAGPLLASVPRDNFKLISKKNIFEPYREPRKEPEKKEPAVDAAAHVRLTGFTHDAQGSQAWLYNRLTNESSKLRPGDDLDLAGVKGKVISVTAAEIVILKDEKEWTLRLGKSLKDLLALAKTEPIPTAKSDSTEAAPDSSKENPVTEEAPKAPEAEETPSGEEPVKVGGNHPSSNSSDAPAVEVSRVIPRG